MEEFAIFIPELILVVTLIGVGFSEVTYHGERFRMVSWIAILGLIAAFIEAIILSGSLSGVHFTEAAISADGMSVFFRLFFIALAILTLIISFFSREIDDLKRSEYYLFILAATIGLCVISSSLNLVVIFIASQLVHAACFFSTSYSKPLIRSIESSVKYLLTSGVSVLLFLFAVSILFGATESFNLVEMSRVLSTEALSSDQGLIAFILLFMSLCFHLALFPFYFWFPDVLEGAPTPTAFFISFGVPVAGIVIGLRTLAFLFSEPISRLLEFIPVDVIPWQKVIAFGSAMTMAIGVLLAMRQRSVKRMLAFLIVAQMGFLSMSFLVLNPEGISALLYNLLINLFSLVGVYAVLSSMFDTLHSDRLADFRGKLRSAVADSTCLLIFFGCFLGLPPLPGFIGRFTLVTEVIRSGWYELALVAIATSVIGYAVFAKFAFSLMDRDQQGAEVLRQFRFTELEKKSQKVFVGALLIPIVFLVVFANSVLDWTGLAFRTHLWE